MIKVALLLLLLTAGAAAQTGQPALIAHVPSDSAGHTTAPVNTAGANAAFICGDAGQTASDSNHNIWEQSFSGHGYGGSIAIYSAFGMTPSAAQTFSLTGGTPFVVMAFSHVASGPDRTLYNGTGAYPQVVGPVTPGRSDELVAACTMEIYGRTDTPQIGFDPPFTLAEKTVQKSSDPTIAWVPGFAGGYLVQGSNPTSSTLTIQGNERNGQNSLLATFYADSAPIPLAITSTAIPSVMATDAYPPGMCATIVGGTAPYTRAYTGTLPKGMTFDKSSGCLSGTPPTTSEGKYTIHFTATDRAGATATSSALAFSVTPVSITVDSQAPAYGWEVHTNSERNLGAILTGSFVSTGKVNWAVTEGSSFATLSCTSNCPGATTVHVTAAEGSCTVPQDPVHGVGHYTIAAAVKFHVTATAVDANEDGSHTTATQLFNVCEGKPGVEVEPGYNQAFHNQTKLLVATIPGKVIQHVNWSCIAPDKSNCSSLLNDTDSRMVSFTAPATGTGRYKITATDALDPRQSNYGWVYVGGDAPKACGPDFITPSKTEATACFADPAFKTSYSVKADGTGSQKKISDLPLMSGHIGGFIAMVYNQDTTGSNPTVYPTMTSISVGGTRDTPVYICGVVDQNACRNPKVTPKAGTSANEEYETSQYEKPQGWGYVFRPRQREGAGGNWASGSSGPDYMNITGFDMFCDLCTANMTQPTCRLCGGTTNYGNDNHYMGIYTLAGRHMHYEGNSFDRAFDGIFVANNTYNGPRNYTEYYSIFGNSCNWWSSIDGFGNHCMYIQSMHNFIVGNTFGTTLPPYKNISGGAGQFLKNRGGDMVLAYNNMIGFSSFPGMFLGPPMSDTHLMVAVDMHLGLPGDTECGNSYWCTYPTGNITIPELVDHSEALAHDYMFGNLVDSSVPVPLFSYGEMNRDECGCFSNMESHYGRFAIYNNTFDRQSPAVSRSNTVWYNSNEKGPVYSWPRLLYQNNVMWTDSDHRFEIDDTGESRLDFKTNMFNTGTVDIHHPIKAGNRGWGNNVEFQKPWTGWQNKEAYVTGVDPANFLFAPKKPYNGGSFAPDPSSPLVGAGTPTIAEQTAVYLPVRFQPNVNGWIRRRSHPDTIGAFDPETSAQPRLVAAKLDSYLFPGQPLNLDVPPGKECQHCVEYVQQYSNGFLDYNWYRIPLPEILSSNIKTITVDQMQQPVYTGTPGSGTITATYEGVKASIPFTAGTGSSPLTIKAASLPAATAGQPYSVTLAAAGGHAPYTWTATNLPAGFTLSRAGVFSSRNPLAGSFSGVTFQVTDSAGATTSSTAALAVQAAANSVVSSTAVR